MMHSMAATARRQARLVVGWKQSRERPKPKQQHEKNAEGAPHREHIE
jgi:hypothetical protein